MKTYVDILGSIIQIKKDHEGFIKGERYHVITKEYGDDIVKYELSLIADIIPEKRIWCSDEFLIALRRNRIIKI